MATKLNPLEREKKRPWTMPHYDDEPRLAPGAVVGKPLTRKEVANSVPVQCFHCRETFPPTHAHQVLVRETWRWTCADCRSIVTRPR